jgi:hypothetical protein
MDSDALVEEQIELGRKVIGLLKLKGIDVTAAAWVKAGERDIWSFSIATEDVDKNGKTAAYLEIHGALRSMPEAYFPTLDFKVIGASHPLARDIQKVLGEPAASIPVRYRGSLLGGMGVDGVYIYPPSEPLRLAFTVAYSRFGETNHWLARTERGELLRGTRARGAMGYLTARWRSDQEGIERFANRAGPARGRAAIRRLEIPGRSECPTADEPAGRHRGGRDVQISPSRRGDRAR